MNDGSFREQNGTRIVEEIRGGRFKKPKRVGSVRLRFHLLAMIYIVETDLECFSCERCDADR